MNIISALMKENLRITNGDRWLYFDESTKEWVVREHIYRKRNTTVVCRTMLQEEAIKALLNQE